MGDVQGLQRDASRWERKLSPFQLLDACWDFGSHQTWTRIQMHRHIWVSGNGNLNSRVASELSRCASGSLWPCHLAVNHHKSSTPLAIAFCIHSWRGCSCKSQHAPASFSVLFLPFALCKALQPVATSTLPTCRHSLFLSGGTLTEEPTPLNMPVTSCKHRKAVLILELRWGRGRDAAGSLTCRCDGRRNW